MSIETTMKVIRDKKNNIEKVQIRGGYVYYCKVQQPSPIYEQRLSKNPDKFEYTIDLIVSEDTADEWDEIFTKQTSSKLTKEKFMSTYKIETEEELPFDSKKYFRVKIKQAAQKSDGTPVHKRIRPRVVMIEDGKPVDVTFDLLVGNGSKADVLANVSTNDYGTFSYLYRVLVTDLIEYNASTVDEDEEDFLGGSLELAETEDEEPTTSPSSDDGPILDDDEEDELPLVDNNEYD